MGDRFAGLNRRGFLTGAGLGVVGGTVGVLALPAALQAAGLTPDEQANVKAVEDLIAAFIARDSARLVSHFTPDAVFRAGTVGNLSAPRTPAFLKDLVDRSSGVQMKVVDTFAKASIVVHDRHDRIVQPDRTIVGRWLGIFAFKDGKIAEFTDYTLDRAEW